MRDTIIDRIENRITGFLDSLGHPVIAILLQMLREQMLTTTKGHCEGYTRVTLNAWAPLHASLNWQDGPCGQPAKLRRTYSLSLIAPGFR